MGYFKNLSVKRALSPRGFFSSASGGKYSSGAKGKRAVVGVDFAKAQFFDRQVFAAYERAEKRALSKFGSYVRADAKESMKTTRGRMKLITRGPRRGEKRRVYEPSAAGTPPRAIEGLMKKFLFFVYDKYTQNVIIGPVLLPNKSRRGVPIPGLHEHGGTQTVKFGKKQVVAHYPARPYMRPAGEKNVRKLGDLWKDAIK